MNNKAEEIILKFHLQSHPEGGWFREVYRSEEIILSENLPERYNQPHNFSTSIYFLLESEDFSAFHRIRSDETWHFYLGSPLVIYTIDPFGNMITTIMGSDFEDGQVLQYTIPRNYWFAVKIFEQDSFSFVGCTVSPGFEFEDFELAQYSQLSELYPQHVGIIQEFTRK